jgi:plasmid stabilization system protein ParE
LKAVEGKINVLKRAPFFGSPSTYLTGCRKTLVPPYHALIYKVNDDSTEIVRVFDLRQDPAKMK